MGTYRGLRKVTGWGKGGKSRRKLWHAYLENGSSACGKHRGLPMFTRTPDGESQCETCVRVVYGG